MASSQARLLTLTARMHQIEYKAAKLEAQKLQLANESQRVYETYLDALDQTKIERKILNKDASIGYTSFTANDIYTYNQLDKQYTLQTITGKTLIPASIHNAYNSAATEAEFLNNFVTIKDSVRTVHHDAVDGKPVLDTSGYNAAVSNYNDEVAAWEIREPDIENYKSETANSSLAEAFEDAGDYCYRSAVNNNNVGCYAHVLAHIIDYTKETGLGDRSQQGCNKDFYNSAANSYTTTTGKNFSINSLDITGAGMDDRGGINDLTMSLVSEYLNKGEQAPILDDDPAFASVDLSTEAKKLASMYNTNGTPKTMKQWAEDLYYLCKNYSELGTTKEAVAPTITIFQRHLVGGLNGYDFNRYKNDYNQWESEEPQAPNKEDYTTYTAAVPAYDEEIPTIVASDRDKAQWYSNIWNDMNNSDVEGISSTVGTYTATDGSTVNGYAADAHPKNTDSYITNNYFGTPENENYIVIPDQCLNDPVWLSNIINDGFAVLQVYVPKEEKLIDTSVAVDVDLREVPDETAIKKAEAKYEADMKKIDLKDRRYDIDLAAIETERNAIKQEMETLKTVTKDNVERTFKLFG